MAIEPSSLPAQAPPRVPTFGRIPSNALETAAVGAHLWGEGEFSFWDLLDIVNPLQHVPVVSTLYRELTGDGIGAVARLAGGGLLGGIPGLVSAVIDVALEDSTGKDVGENVLALLEGGPEDESSALAQRAIARPPAAAAQPSLAGKFLAQLSPEARAATLELREAQRAVAVAERTPELRPEAGDPAERAAALEAYEQGGTIVSGPARAVLAQRA